jgi:hypothetical protein
MPVAEAGLEAGEQAVVGFAESVELIGLDRVGLDHAFVFLGLEFTADLGLGTVGVHVEGAREPLAPLGQLQSQVAGPGDVRAFTLVRVLDNGGKRGLRAALTVLGPLQFARRLAVEALLIVERGAPLHAVIAVAEGQEGARIGLAVVVIGAHTVNAAGQFRAFLQDDVERAADALAVDVAAGAADDLDALDQFGRDAVDDHRVVVGAAGHAPAIDQHLGVLGADAAQAWLRVLADVALEADAGDALHHIADR